MNAKKLSSTREDDAVVRISKEANDKLLKYVDKLNNDGIPSTAKSVLSQLVLSWEPPRALSPAEKYHTALWLSRIISYANHQRLHDDEVTAIVADYEKTPDSIRDLIEGLIEIAASFDPDDTFDLMLNIQNTPPSIPANNHKSDNAKKKKSGS